MTFKQHDQFSLFFLKPSFMLEGQNPALAGWNSLATVFGIGSQNMTI
jgi:hypothetical protein